jgi:hypothetical protein
VDIKQTSFFAASGKDRRFEELRLSPDLKDHRESIEKMWELFQPLADLDFLSKARDNDFPGRYWELYLGCSLLHQGIQMTPRRERRHQKKGSNKGPDFEITSPLHYWLEAVAAEGGTGDDAIPEIQLGVVSAVPDDEAKLRILTAIRAKEKQRRSYVEDGIVGPDDCYVVAINLAKAPFVHDDEPPRIVRAVLGLGFRQVSVAHESGVIRDAGWQRQEKILRRHSEEPVSTLIFHPGSPDSAEYVGIAAVLYSEMSPYNSIEPMFDRTRYAMGDDYRIVHNPRANPRLPTGFLKLGREYSLEGDVLKREDWFKRAKGD